MVLRCHKPFLFQIAQQSSKLWQKWCTKALIPGLLPPSRMLLAPHTRQAGLRLRVQVRMYGFTV